MGRYTLEELYASSTSFSLALTGQLAVNSSLGMTMGLINSDLNAFVANIIYGYFYEDLVAYEGDTTSDVKSILLKRLSYDITLKYPYWSRKYNQIKALLTTEDFSLLQTSKMTSESSDNTKSVGGSLQKGATTPTGVSTGTSTDSITLDIDDTTGENEITTEGFVDKYTSHQQKYANASEVQGEREGTILREGSIEDLLKVLEKLPSSFADEVNREVQKHFIFDYDGEDDDYYTEDE